MDRALDKIGCIPRILVAVSDGAGIPASRPMRTESLHDEDKLGDREIGQAVVASLFDPVPDEPEEARIVGRSRGEFLTAGLEVDDIVHRQP